MSSLTQNADDWCNGQSIINCIAFKRISLLLKFYHNNHDKYNEVAKYSEKYKQNLLADYHHILDKHLNEDKISLNESNQQFGIIYKQLNNDIPCNIENCKIYSRSNRQRDTSSIDCEDKHLRATLDIIDTIHCYFLHSVDTGYRIMHPMTTRNESKNNDCKDENKNKSNEDNQSFDSKMKGMRSYISSKRKKLQKINGNKRLRSNKFMTNVTSYVHFLVCGATIYSSCYLYR